MGAFWTLWFISTALAIFVGYRIGEKKGRKGWLWAILLGWIGVIIVACLSPTGVALDRIKMDEMERELRLREMLNQHRRSTDQVYAVEEHN